MFTMSVDFSLLGAEEVIRRMRIALLVPPEAPKAWPSIVRRRVSFSKRERNYIEPIMTQRRLKRFRRQLSWIPILLRLTFAWAWRMTP